MLGDLRKAVWSEIVYWVAEGGCLPSGVAAGVRDADREQRFGRRLRQRSRVELPGGGGQGAQAPTPNAGEIKNMLRGELRDLDRELASASAKAGDRETRLHVEGIRAQIKEILEPKQ